MATLRVYKKPEDLKLPKKYTRLPLPDSNSNYVFCRSLNTDIEGFELYQIGIYFIFRYEILYPEKDGLVTKTVESPKMKVYHLYLPRSENVMYCIGDDIDLLHEPMTLFNDGKDLFSSTLSLERIEKAHQQGRIRLIGQTCLKRNGTLRLRQRKTDGNPFRYNDPDFQLGTGVNNECFEVLMRIGSTEKPFFIYPDGVITTRGRSGAHNLSFTMLRRVYTTVKNV